MIEIPLRLGLGPNSREHWRVRTRRVKAEREAVGFALAGKPKPALPCMVRITRIAPSNGLDDDNLAGSCKGARDAIADWLVINDRDPRVLWRCAQERGRWGVRIEFAVSKT